MPKKMTDEEKKAWGAKMKAAREAKQIKDNPSISTTTKASSEAGITPPALEDKKLGMPGTVIQQADQAELRKELDELTLSDFVKKHTDDSRANVDAMAKAAHLQPQDIRDIQRDLGYELPQGA